MQARRPRNSMSFTPGGAIGSFYRSRFSQREKAPAFACVARHGQAKAGAFAYAYGLELDF